METWLRQLVHTDPKSADLVAAAVDVLKGRGPALGRPLVDRVHSCRFHHMKELRPGSAGGTEIRILFAFDQMRQAVRSVAGDKAGDWRRWYEQHVVVADERFIDHPRR